VQRVDWSHICDFAFIMMKIISLYYSRAQCKGMTKLSIVIPGPSAKG
jgi:hypothetical protein